MELSPPPPPPPPLPSPPRRPPRRPPRTASPPRTSHSPSCAADSRSELHTASGSARARLRLASRLAAFCQPPVSGRVRSAAGALTWRGLGLRRARPAPAPPLARAITPLPPSRGPPPPPPPPPPSRGPPPLLLARAAAPPPLPPPAPLARIAPPPPPAVLPRLVRGWDALPARFGTAQSGPPLHAGSGTPSPSVSSTVWHTMGRLHDREPRFSLHSTTTGAAELRQWAAAARSPLAERGVVLGGWCSL